MIGYTTFTNDNEQIELSAILVKSGDSDEFRYGCPTITFRNDFGKELETWDGERYMREFIDHLKNQRWALLDDMLTSEGPSEVTLEYVKRFETDINEIWDSARRIGMV